MSSKFILVVEDDNLLSRSVAFNLQKAGYTVRTTTNAENALALLQNERVDLILLDIGLPGMDGLEALTEFRKQADLPIIFITARRQEMDEVAGLELGADDYITKPFSNSVLLARIKVALRHRTVENTAPSLIEAGNLHIDVLARTVAVGERIVEMSPKEFDLLAVLAQNAGHVLSVDDLLMKVWGENWIGELQTVYVHIRWLREKIEQDPAHPKRLLTVKGVGYKLVAIDE